MDMESVRVRLEAWLGLQRVDGLLRFRLGGERAYQQLSVWCVASFSDKPEKVNFFIHEDIGWLRSQFFSPSEMWGTSGG